MLRYSQVCRVEECWRPLDLGELSAHGSVQQSRRSEKPTGVKKHFITGVVSGHDHNAGEVVGDVHSADGFASPGTWRHDLHLAGHVGECDYHQPVACPCVLMQTGACIRREDHGQFRCAVQELLIIRGQQRAGLIDARTGVPVGA